MNLHEKARQRLLVLCEHHNPVCLVVHHSHLVYPWLLPRSSAWVEEGGAVKQRKPTQSFQECIWLALCVLSTWSLPHPQALMHSGWGNCWHFQPCVWIPEHSSGGVVTVPYPSPHHGCCHSSRPPLQQGPGFWLPDLQCSKQCFHKETQCLQMSDVPVVAVSFYGL